MIEKFKKWFGFPSVQGSINGTQILIVKPISYVKD